MRLVYLVFYYSLILVCCKGQVIHRNYLNSTYNDSIQSESKIKPISQEILAESFNYTIPLGIILDSLNIDPSQINVLISKSNYRLYIRIDTLVIKSYPIVFGLDPVNDKLKEGDGCTPEGDFKMISKYPHNSWTYFIWINYPTEESWRRHNQAINKGIIPIGSAIGGQIGIHGVPHGYDNAIDQRSNWTLGCISLKNNDITEIYPIFNTNTIIKITK
jgi:murein L,D-transpeptidase YafK